MLKHFTKQKHNDDGKWQRTMENDRKDVEELGEPKSNIFVIYDRIKSHGK